MLDQLKLHGAGGSIMWGYRPAVEFSVWKISKDARKRWILRGTPTKIDAFVARQRPLLFTAPRQGGRWAWVVESVECAQPGRVVAILGQPEQ